MTADFPHPPRIPSSARSAPHPRSVRPPRRQQAPEGPALGSLAEFEEQRELAWLLGPEANKDPIAWFESLRRQFGTVAPIRLDGDLTAWMVLGYREVLEVSNATSRYSRDSRNWRPFKENRVPPDFPLLPMMAWQPVSLFLDGEERDRLRVSVAESLDSYDRRGLQRHILHYTRQLVSKFAERGEADLVDEFTEQLPLLVMTKMLGMPEEYGPRLVRASRDMVAGTETSVSSNEFIVEVLERHVRRKLGDPGQDVTSWLIAHPSGLTPEEVWNHLRVILIAANETTVNLMKSMLRVLLTDPRCSATLTGGHLVLHEVMEEVLWSEPPLMTLPGRWASVDTELGGQKIAAGDMLLLGLAAGNQDPAIRNALEDDDLQGNRAHLAFNSGPQECPGQRIGRAIAETSLDCLLTMLPDTALNVDESDLTMQVGWMSRGMAHIPVRFTRPSVTRVKRPGYELEPPVDLDPDTLPDEERTPAEPPAVRAAPWHGPGLSACPVAGAAPFPDQQRDGGSGARWGGLKEWLRG